MKPAHFSMLRAYRAADFFTLANGAAGTGSIFAVISYVEAPDRWRIYLAFRWCCLRYCWTSPMGESPGGRTNIRSLAANSTLSRIS